MRRSSRPWWRADSRVSALGFSSHGFVPPAWLMRTDARPGIFATGVAFTEDAGAIYLAGGRRIVTSALRWSTRTAFRACIGAGGRMAVAQGGGAHR